MRRETSIRSRSVRFLRGVACGTGLLLAIPAGVVHAVPQSAASAAIPAVPAMDTVHGSDDFSLPRQQEQWASRPGQAQPPSNAIADGFDHPEHRVKVQVRPMEPRAAQWYARPPDLQAGPTFDGVR